MRRLDVACSLAFYEQMENAHFSPAADGPVVSRPETTLALTRGVVRLFVDMGLSPLAEFTLANGRRADIAAIDRKGRIAIAEVKSCRADFEGDAKWPEYLDFCDRFYFAVDSAFPQGILPSSEGLIVADAFGAMIAREAASRSMAAARRKAVTLRFARQAAGKALGGLTAQRSAV